MEKQKTKNKAQYESPVMKQFQLTRPMNHVLCASGEAQMDTSLGSMGEWQ